MILTDGEKLETEAVETLRRVEIDPQIELKSIISSLISNEPQNKVLAYKKLLRILVKKLASDEFELKLRDIPFVAAMKWILSRDYQAVNTAAAVIQDSISGDDPKNITYQLRFSRLQKLDFFRVNEN